MRRNFVAPFAWWSFLWLCWLRCKGDDEMRDFVIGSDLEDRARIIMVNGNVYFFAGAHKNLSFVPSVGGGIYLGDTDVRSLPNKTQINTLNLLLESNSQVMKLLHSSVAATEQKIPVLSRELVILRSRQSALATTVRRMNDTRARNRNAHRLRHMISKLTIQVEKLYKLIRHNDCLAAPCMNGGVCLDLFGDYKCLCPKHFVGKQCQTREDECHIYSGTHAGCQNNATCINNKDVTGFTCQCSSGWHGPLCQWQESTCSKVHNLCGEHGHCVEKATKNKIGYDCICDWGYRKTTDPLNPTCIDIDECANSPCFPGANCLNFDGGFKCESCPAGYIGNGINCIDFDECSSKYTHDCSKHPEVECINTVGSYICGGCPEGYIGDGFTCERQNFCDSDPCVSNALCLNHQSACMCPEGSVGDGKKNGEGCEVRYYRSCSMECANGGTCRITSDNNQRREYICLCPLGFYGHQCEFEDLCVQADYCNHRGRCIRDKNSATCECYKGYYEQKCQTVEVPGCSFHTANETGVIEFQPSTESATSIYRVGNFTAPPACAWVINLRDTRKIIELWFDYFEQDNTNQTSCDYRDYITIFDTNIKPVDLLADMCTDKRLPRHNTPIYSASNSLNINYFFMNTANKSRVKMNWRAVEPICGARFIQQTATLEYTSERAFEQCLWYISVKAGYFLEITVESVVMLSGEFRNCSINQLEIYDDSFIGDSPRQGLQLCQTESKQVVRRLSGRNAVVRLSLNSYNASEENLSECRMFTGAENNTDERPSCKVYFRLTYKSIDLPDNCGGEIQLLNPSTIEDSIGYIESPNYQHAYFPNLNCLWLLDATNAFNNSIIQELAMIRLEFVDLDVDGGGQNNSLLGDPKCPGDYVKISTNPEERFCNAYPPKVIYAKERVKIEFVTTDQSQYKSHGTGFRIKYQSMCYQEFGGENGTIQSPYLREPSPMPFKCHYQIKSTPQAVVTLSFKYIGLTTFNLACILPRMTQNRSDDYFEFSGGHSSNIQVNKRYYCARYPFSTPNGEFVVSGTKGLSFVYSTSGSKDNTGFLFHYSVQNIDCGGISVGVKGTIKSPNYPERYPPHMYCIWNLILFKPDDLGVYANHGIRLIFDVFNVENVASRDDCGFDVVRVYEHYRNENDHGQLLGQFCGLKPPPPILSKDPTLAVVFMSDRSVSGTGFFAHWEAVNFKFDCNRVYTEPTGLIQFNSADFERVTTCDIQIVLPSMNRIELQIENVTLPCDEGQIIIRNGGHETSPAFSDLFGESEMCDGKVVKRLQSQGNQVFIRLIIRNTKHAALKIRYEQIASSCGGYIRGFAGAISAPQYPHEDSRMLNCKWTIAVALGNLIRLQFLKIDNLDSADRSGICAPFARNFIDVTSSESPDAHVIKRYCRKETAPDPIDSDDNFLVVEYNQNGGSINGGLFGFLAQYRTVCENVELDSAYGSIQSPGFPYNISETRNCMWTIRTTPGSFIKVKFHEFRIHEVAFRRVSDSNQLECLNNYLELDLSQVSHVTAIVQGVGTTNLTRPRLCSQVAEPISIYSKSNELRLQFQSSSKPSNHFWLSWSTVGCGGTVLQNNTQIRAVTSDFVSTNLSARRECQWVLKAPVGFIPQVIVKELYTEENLDKSSKTCYRDPNDKDNFSGLEFFYGTRVGEYVQHELCGSQHNQVVTAYSNEMLIRLRFDGRRPNAFKDVIFQANISYVQAPLNSTCGGIINIAYGTNKTIHSPNYPLAYPRAVECIWQFETEPGYTIAYNLSAYSTPNQHAKRVSGISRPNQNTRCSYALGYIEGNIAFFSTAYNRSQSPNMYGISRSGAIQRICVDIEKPVIVQTGSNVSSVVFNGAPYEASMPSGDVKRPASIGFQFEVFTKCGGTIYASKRRKMFVLEGRHIDQDGESECVIEIKRDRENEEKSMQSPIYLRFEYHSKMWLPSSNESDASLPVTIKCDEKIQTVIVEHTMSSQNQQSRQVKCDNPMTLIVASFPDNDRLIIVYDTELQFCGGTLFDRGIVNLGRLVGDLECEWTFENFDGNTVEIRITNSYLEPSDFCAQSYLELRHDNKSGAVFARRCGEISGFTVKAGSKTYMRLRRLTDTSAFAVDDDSKTSQDKNDDDELASDLAAVQRDATFSFSYKMEFGGQTSETHISIPTDITDFIDHSNPDNKRLAWLLTARNSTNCLAVTIHKLKNLDVQLLDYHCPAPCLNPQSKQKAIVLEDHFLSDRRHLIYSNTATVLATGLTSRSRLDLHWQEFLINQPTTNTIKVVRPVTRFNCGGELNPTYQTQTFSLPTVNGEYESGMLCKWTFKRPMLSSIHFKFKKLDLEDHPACLYDFVIILTKNYESLEDVIKSPYTHYCRKNQIGLEVTVNHEDSAYVYFVSDQSASYSGFTIEYYIYCRTFEYIPSANGLLDIILESPLYPETYRQNYSCLWGIMLESNRNITVTSLDMNLAPRSADGQCIEDALRIGNFSYALNPTRKVSEYCDNEPVNFIANNGRVYIEFDKQTISTKTRRGYRLRIKEVVHACSSQTLYVDEHTKSAQLTSPNFPNLAPNSLDCRWTLSVPVGHRLKFTIDPNNFNLQNTNSECTDDFIEIRDGASESAPFIGKYCNKNPPSTIISTDSHLFVRFSTDNHGQSFAWNATYELASCGGTLILQEHVNSTIASTHYPDVYPAHETCEWVVKPPLAHFVHARFNQLWLFVSDNCAHDYITMREDNKNGTEIMPPVCTYRNVNQTGYYFSSDAYVKFQSNSSIQRSTRMFCLNKKCGFQIEFASSPFKCGGVISDEEGERYLHINSQNKIVPGLKCKFDFRAGIGYRYKIDFFWLNADKDLSNHGFYHRTNMYDDNPLDWCLPDLEVWNGLQENRYNLFGMHQRFCRNRTSFVSSTDIASMLYVDRSEMYNMYYKGFHEINETIFRKPFGIRYTKVEANYDQNSCMYHVVEDAKIEIKNLKYSDKTLTRDYGGVVGQSKSFCHIRIDNPLRSSTITLNFTDFRAGRREANMCGDMDNKVVMTDSGTHAWPINEVLCTGIVKDGNISFVYNNPIIDIYAQNNPFSLAPMFDTTVKFNLTVQFHACGGFITQDEAGSNSGVIVSPGWNRGNYTNLADCLWTLEAPEGQVVALNFTFMDIDYQIHCDWDYLELSEGEDRHAVIHRYCGYTHTSSLDDEQRLADRYRFVKSHGRYLTLYFHSDASISRRGFSVSWEFTSFEKDMCGFTSHAISGVIHSPNYPNDYPNNAVCSWFIIVPVGFHIRLEFQHLDIQESLDCEDDRLMVSQEHQARDQDPLSIYYFYYDHEQWLNTTCGSQTQAPIVTDSNQMRVNFTSNSKITAKGFNLTWKAECGTTFKTSHGVVTSPFYPRYYPNDNFECNYMINPENDGVQIVTLKLVDTDLDTTTLTTARDCNSDFIEIKDVMRNNLLLQHICGNSLMDADLGTLFSVRGPVSVRFVSNISMLHDYEHRRKNHRGFKITYSLSDCGGEINLGEMHNRLAGTINSPGYPLPYHNDLNCIWNVTAPVGYVIAVKFTGIDIEASENCFYDYVEIFDGPHMLNESSFGRLCGPQPPQGHRLTSTNSAVVHFVSDQTSTSAGFMAVLTATLGTERGCGGKLQAKPQMQKLVAPYDNTKNTYFNNLRCMWKIATQTDQIVEIKLTMFEMEKRYRMGNTSECYDFMAIYDGPASISPFLLKPICELPRDIELPAFFYSSLHMVEVYFESDYSEAFSGFELEYRAVNEDCGGVYNAYARAGEITYESKRTTTRTNQRQKRCRFFIRGTENEPIELEFSQFNFPTKTNQCVDEYLEVRDVGTVAECEHPACASQQSDAKNVIRTCGQNVPPRFVSRTSLVQIVTSVLLQSQYSATFSLKYRLLDSCNRSIEIKTGSERWASGHITSPNFPKEYNHNSTCITSIQVPLNKRIFVVFKSFLLERGNMSVYHQWGQRVNGDRLSIPCSFDNLTIIYNNSQPTQNETYCGWSTPPARVTPNNTITLQLQTNDNHALSGFSAYYFTTSVVTDPQLNHVFYNFAPIYERDGFLANIGWPGYTQNTTQRWTVIPPAGMTCAVRLYSYMSRTRSCNSGEKAKWAHYSGSAPDRWIDLPCYDPYNMVPQNLSAGEKMMFEVTTDENADNNGLGFRAMWSCENADTPVFMIDEWEQVTK